MAGNINSVTIHKFSSDWDSSSC